MKQSEIEEILRNMLREATKTKGYDNSALLRRTVVRTSAAGIVDLNEKEIATERRKAVGGFVEYLEDYFGGDFDYIREEIEGYLKQQEDKQ